MPPHSTTRGRPAHWRESDAFRCWIRFATFLRCSPAASLVVVDFHPIQGHPRPDAGAMYMLGVFKVVDDEIRIIDEIREILPLKASSGWWESGGEVDDD